MRINLEGIDTYYEDHGKGKPVVLLHGLALDSTIWNDVVSRYSIQARFITPDLRGHGRTETGQGKGTLEQFADDLFALVSYLGLKSLTLVGHSMGGYIALAFANKYPEKLDDLIMVTSNARPDPPEKQESRLKDAELALSNGMAAIAAGMAQNLTKSDEIRQRVTPILEKTPPEGFANAQRAIASRSSRFELIHSLEIPFLAIAGSEDQLMRTDSAYDMAGCAQQGRAVVLPGVGHLPMLEAPLALGALIVSRL
ncbi:MAG: alpha/beta hydrolase [Anaerolineaceae bacterium]|nr:alpha/beta hydrolase [Anaerolineaceae bacterium]MDD4043334.1 alpha/beta hydrolase [Anaerolineaceae bacterium]MDD4578176.1 alpha/beta hydrolase [Anaerolineaceae bacterium]